MHPFYSEFVSYLDREDKERCVTSVLSRLSSGQLDLITLYYEVLTPALKESFCKDERRAIYVWEEHVRTSIVRTIIECCYPHLLRERDDKYGAKPGGRVVVGCPTEEYHEIGARMVADFFSLCGFDVVFVGANTPQDDIIEALQYVHPEYLAMSVTIPHNLVAARKVTKRLRELRDSSGAQFQIVVGGQAFYHNRDIASEMGADLLLDTFEDIKHLAGDHSC
jgi:methanogenic corrinoid protein MtbC1